MKRSIITFLFLFCGLCYGQTYSGKSTNTFYRCSLKINKDSTVIFNFRQKNNIVYGDFTGRIRKLNDSLFLLSCKSVFDQYLMKNYFAPDLCISVDSILDQSHKIKFIKVNYSCGLDTIYHLKNCRKSSEAWEKVCYRIKDNHAYHVNGNNDMFIDVGYKSIFTGKPVIFTLNTISALDFGHNTTFTTFIVIKNGTVKSVKDHITQTGSFVLKQLKTGK